MLYVSFLYKMFQKETFLSILLKWYATYHRALPWRNTKNPYKIWVSEVILQQTRTTQGLPYYVRFLERFPNLRALAESSEEELLRVWQGLGYYARARNMHQAARTLIHEYGGSFPRNPAALEKIKGIGPYTAAAIASFAFGYPAPVLDGNVFRFSARYFGIQANISASSSRPLFMKKLNMLIKGQDPALFNQAMMEFGSQQCAPQPLCRGCPLQRGCYAFSHQKVSTLPQKSPQRPQRIRYFHYIALESPQGMLLRRRAAQDIWKGLYDFYAHEDHRPLLWADICNVLPTFTEYDLRKESAWYRHMLTHQRIMARFFHVQLPTAAIPTLAQQYHLQHIHYEQVDTIPKPILIANYLKNEKILLYLAQ